MPYADCYITEAYHGGHCCGMSTIWRFPASPIFDLLERKKRTAEEQTAYCQASPHNSRNVNDEYPKQTAGDRLRQMVKNIEEGIPNLRISRSMGIIEIVLTASQCFAWEDLLKELDFKEVNRAVNSNSHRTIVVFHRNSGQ